jgi:hypothetical protein
MGARLREMTTAKIPLQAFLMLTRIPKSKESAE